MVQRVNRHDAPNPAKIIRLPGGGIRVEAALSRTGIQRYQDSDGKERLEYRPPSEVFSPEAMASFRGVPLTIGHPKEFLSPDNYKDLQVGHVCDDVKADGDLLSASVIVMDRYALQAIDADALREVSCGYTVDVDETPGVTPEGERYDAVQTHLIGNHLALVPPHQGRGGSRVSLRLDSSLSSVMPDPIIPAPVAPLATPAADPFKARNDALEGENRALKSQLVQLKSELSKAKDPTRVDALVAERGALLAEALPLLGADYALAGKSADEVMRDVVALRMPEERVDAKSSPEYIKGLFRGIVAGSVNAPHPNLGKVRADATQARTIDGVQPNANPLQEASARRLRKDAERCKPPGRVDSVGVTLGGSK